MSTDERARLTLRIMRHEGPGPMKAGRHLMYQDTVGKWSVGYGRNLSDRGLSKDEALFLLENDLNDAIHDCMMTFPWFSAMDSVRQQVLVELVFNMGLPTVLTFKHTLKWWGQGDYVRAAAHLRRSKWFTQVGALPEQRGGRLVRMLETGLEAA